MSTYTQIIYQIVFSTKFRNRVLSKENRIELFKFISGILLNKKCHLYQINGVEDHIHVLTHIHPTIALSSLVKDIKVASSLYIKEKRLFDGFTSWQEGYGAFTYNIKQKHRLIEYVKNQEEHHKKRTYKEEYKALLIENGIEFDEKYLL
jgi:putative transposase